jgi:uncharacterized protein YdhG (YjbR/CyaY superfamily)
LAAYPGGKGTVQLPLDKALPLDLIRRIVKFRLQWIREWTAAKARPKKSAAKAKPRKRD